jgi:allantoin racemase
MRIRNILTVVSPRVEAGLTDQRKRWGEADVVIEVEKIRCGPYSLEFAAEERVAAPYILEAVIRAERERVDAVIPECMLDPALRAARELVDIPVISPAKAGMAFAITLGMRVAIVGVRNGLSLLEEVIRSYGLIDHVCNIRTVDVPPAELAEGSTESFEMISEEAFSAMENDRADVILLGCTAMSIFTKELQDRLGIPVVEPSACAIRMAIDMVRMGLSHSKVCYPTPPERPSAPGSISIWNPSSEESTSWS